MQNAESRSFLHFKYIKDEPVFKKKPGKLLTSRRYDHLPLLHSCPGGFSRSWPYKTCQGCKCRTWF